MKKFNLFKEIIIANKAVGIVSKVNILEIGLQVVWCLIELKSIKLSFDNIKIPYKTGLN